MRGTRYTEEQIVGILKEQERGVGTEEAALFLWHQPADVLSLEGEVRRPRSRRRSETQGAGGREPAAETAGRRPGAGQRGAQGRAVKKLVRPAVRRSVVHYLGEQWSMSERHACGLAQVCRSTVRYRVALARRRNGGGSVCASWPP